MTRNVPSRPRPSTKKALQAAVLRFSTAQRNPPGAQTADEPGASGASGARWFPCDSAIIRQRPRNYRRGSTPRRDGAAEPPRTRAGRPRAREVGAEPRALEGRCGGSWRDGGPLPRGGLDRDHHATDEARVSAPTATPAPSRQDAQQRPRRVHTGQRRPEPLERPTGERRAPTVPPHRDPPLLTICSTKEEQAPFAPRRSGAGGRSVRVAPGASLRPWAPQGRFRPRGALRPGAGGCCYQAGGVPTLGCAR
jgi:hypothetical protein